MIGNNEALPSARKSVWETAGLLVDVGFQAWIHWVEELHIPRPHHMGERHHRIVCNRTVQVFMWLENSEHFFFAVHQKLLTYLIECTQVHTQTVYSSLSSPDHTSQHQVDIYVHSHQYKEPCEVCWADEYDSQHAAARWIRWSVKNERRCAPRDQHVKLGGTETVV